MANSPFAPASFLQPQKVEQPQPPVKQQWETEKKAPVEPMPASLPQAVQPLSQTSGGVQPSAKAKKSLFASNKEKDGTVVKRRE